MKKDQLIKKVATKLKISQAKAAEAVKIICGSNVITNQQQIKVVTVEKKVPVQVIKEVVKIVKIEVAAPAAKKATPKRKTVVRKSTPKRKPAAKKVVKKTAKKVVKKATPKKVTAKKVVKKAAPKRKAVAKKVVKKATPKKVTAKKVVKKTAPKRKAVAKKVVKKTTPKKVTAKKVVKKAAPKRKAVAKKVVKKSAPRKVAAPRKVDPRFSKFKINNFQIIEGIGPKIEELLHRAKIKNWNELATTSPTQLKKILSAAGNRFQMHDPTTWGKQAKMAQTGAWKELVKYQKVLDAGKNNGKNRRSPSKVERMAGLKK